MHTCSCWWSYTLSFVWVWLSLPENITASCTHPSTLQPSTAGFPEKCLWWFIWRLLLQPARYHQEEYCQCTLSENTSLEELPVTFPGGTRSAAPGLCSYRIFICRRETFVPERCLLVPGRRHRPLVSQAKGRTERNGFDQRLPTFIQPNAPSLQKKMGLLSYLPSFWGEKREGKLSTFLKRQWAFCIPDLSLAEGMLISCWAMALIILAKAKMYTSWLTLVSTGCWSMPKRLCALLPSALSQATWYFSEPYIALEELYRGALHRMA